MNNFHHQPQQQNHQQHPSAQAPAPAPNPAPTPTAATQKVSSYHRNIMSMNDVLREYQQQQKQQNQQQQQQMGHVAGALLLTNSNGNASNNNNNHSSHSGVGSSISNLLISHNSSSISHNQTNNNSQNAQNSQKLNGAWGQTDTISALWGCSSSSGCSSGSGSQPSLSPTASSHSKEMLLWTAQTSPSSQPLRDNASFKELQPQAASPTASLTSSSGASSTSVCSTSNGWNTSSGGVGTHYGKANIWELPGQSAQRLQAHDIFTDLLSNLSIRQDSGSQSQSQSQSSHTKADASDVSSNSSSSAGELLEMGNIWRHSVSGLGGRQASEANTYPQIYEEPTGGAACMQLFNDYLNMN
ncbi:headcase protein [Drosophila madeirensis]|uniref:Headcase protein n=1 Tax=Drosophila madeirensis TaxID=30013 RepID=A0AAU9FBU0_DROMD